MAHDDSRDFFCRQINVYRSQQCFAVTNQLAFEGLCAMIRAALDRVALDFDTPRALKLVILSNTFYFQKPGESRVYLQEGIKGNPLWRNMDFWERAVFESIREELRQNFFDPEMDDEERSTLRKNLIFAKLCSVQHDMLSFEVPKPEVKFFISQFCTAYGLTE